MTGERRYLLDKQKMLPVNDRDRQLGADYMEIFSLG